MLDFLIYEKENGKKAYKYRMTDKTQNYNIAYNK